MGQCNFGSEKNFCLLDDGGLESECEYIDLIKNPERYTGYSGDSARRVWGAIYEQNCFPFVYGHGQSNVLGRQALSDDICLEKRTFYRVVSGNTAFVKNMFGSAWIGLHSSISVHLCEQWLDKSTGRWGPNPDCFHSRVGDYRDRLVNLYSLFAILLQAVHRISPQLRNTKLLCSGLHPVDASVTVCPANLHTLNTLTLIRT